MDDFNKITNTMIKMEKSNRPYTKNEGWEEKRRESAQHFDEAASQYIKRVGER